MRLVQARTSGLTTIWAENAAVIILPFLHRYMVIELKDTEFMPEYIGKLNFYCSAVDDILCREGETLLSDLCSVRPKTGSRPNMPCAISGSR